MQQANRKSAARPHKPPFGWKRLLQDIITAHNGKKADGIKVSSYRTQELRAETLHLSFRELRKLGYKIENPRNLQRRHVEALVHHWESKNLSPATIQLKLSVLRVFCSWIGKPGMIEASEKYVKNAASVKRTYAARQDKGWEALGIDTNEVIAKVLEKDKHVAMQIELQATFGLRRKEAVMFHPFLAYKGTHLVVSEGTKGSRARVVQIDSEEKRAALEKAKALVIASGQGKSGHVSNPSRSLKQNLRRYDNVMSRYAGITKEKAGTTGHGLRSQFVCDRLEQHGIVAPVRGGEKGQLDKDSEELAYRLVSEELGHSRKSVIAAYAGRFIVKEKKG